MEHVPGEPSERMRIEAAGGQVIRAGVQGITPCKSVVLKHAFAWYLGSPLKSHGASEHLMELSKE